MKNKHLIPLGDFIKSMTDEVLIQLHHELQYPEVKPLLQSVISTCLGDGIPILQAQTLLWPIHQEIVRRFDAYSALINKMGIEN